jgi:hypothetical protein
MRKNLNHSPSNDLLDSFKKERPGAPRTVSNADGLPAGMSSARSAKLPLTLSRCAQPWLVHSGCCVFSVAVF